MAPVTLRDAINLADPRAPAPYDNDYWRRRFASSLSPPRPPPLGWSKHYFTGYHFGAISCAASVACVFVINIVTIALVANRTGFVAGTGLLFDGSCSELKTLNLWIHFSINALSTILLSASNYCMQCLSAPIREEIDKAHARNKWLDIGVPSLHNLRHISGNRLAMWLVLCLSSLPLHLFYNSMVFTTIGARQYSVYSGNEGSWQNSSVAKHYWSSGSVSEDADFSKFLEAYRAGSTVQLDNHDCIIAYAQEFQSTYANLLLIVDGPSGTEDTELVFDSLVPRPESASGDSWTWICGKSWGQGCEELPQIMNSVTEWAPAGARVKYCIAQKSTQHCKLYYSLPIGVLVLVANFIKAAVMLRLALGSFDSPLLTIGDAISSFLRRPDPLTTNGNLLSMNQGIRRHVQRDPYAKAGEDPITFRSQRKVFLVIFPGTFILVMSFLIYGVSQMVEGTKRDIPSLWRLGLGAINPATFIRGGSWKVPSTGVRGVTSNVIVANLPQLIFSVLYFSINALYTSVLLSNEWASYAIHRKGLRVSSAPRGAQRTTYKLQLPYRFALPLMGVSCLLHWLISQSLFLVVVEIYDRYEDTAAGEAPLNAYVTCGYSPAAMMSVLLVAGVLFIATLILLAKHKSGVGSCSIAISAACHTLDGSHDDGLVYKPVQWVTETGRDGRIQSGFSTRSVPLSASSQTREPSGF